VNALEILRRRLRTQRLAAGSFARPEEAVDWLVGVQAQDFGAAKWALGQRVAGSTDASLERAFDDGAFLRTHALRPTWHFLSPADIRWVQRLTAPRVHALNAYAYRQFELDDRVFGRAHEVFAEAMGGGRALTRPELGAALAEARIEATGVRLGYITIHGELECLLCSGPRRGKQQTYMLLDERAPGSGREWSGDEALAELTRRFFTSHGPATLRDFAWWSSLRVADVKAGVELVKDGLESHVIDDVTYWHAGLGIDGPVDEALLIPDYDESFVGYRDVRYQPRDGEPRGDLLNASLVLGGETVGTWKRVIDGERIRLEVRLFAPLGTRERRELDAAAERYAAFMQLPVEVQQLD
jgi:hypothetical protein